MIRSWSFIFFFPAIAMAQLPGEFTDTQFLFGYKQNSNLSSLTDEPYEHKLFVEGEGKYFYKNAYEGPGLSYNLRIFGELDDLSEDQYPEVKVNDLTASYKSNSYVLSAGRQMVSWSETFGLNIMDIVNPRDYTYAIFDDLKWSKLPVWLGAAKFFGENWFVELLVNPYGENNKMARPGSEFDPYTSLSLHRKDSEEHKVEYGVRSNYLFQNGLDLSLLYYRHMNRNPFYYLNSQMELEEGKGMVNSYGSTFSYSTNDWVFRGDFLFNDSNPMQDNNLGVVEEDWYQSIVGADYSGFDRFVLAFQVMTDSQENNEWVGFQVQRDLDSFNLSFMSVVGTDNKDVWLRPELKWTGYENLTFKTRFDFMTGDRDRGIIGRFKDNKRLTLELNYFY